MSQTVPLPTPTTVSQVLVQAGVTLLSGDSVGGVPSTVKQVNNLDGWAISESTGSAAAKVRIWDGTGIGAGNFLLAEIDLIAGGQSTDSLDSPAQVRNNALFLQVVSGSVEGSVYWG